MLRYRVMLTGPRRESRGKVRVSPKWLPSLPDLAPFELHCAALACVLPMCFALLLSSPAIHQKLSFSFAALVLLPLHLFTSFSLGSVLGVIMDVPGLPLG